MNRSRSHLDSYHTRSTSLHKPGAIPNACRNISPISAHRHKYEIKQKIWPKQTVESWFENHSSEDRRAVYSFLNTLYNEEGEQQQQQQRHHRQAPAIRVRKSPSLRLANRTNPPVDESTNHPVQRRTSNSTRQESRASKRDLGEILESIESIRLSPSFQERGIQTSATPLTGPLPDINGVRNARKAEKRTKRSPTPLDKYTETVQPPNATDESIESNENKLGRRYLSHSWRVINPREDVEANVRPENNSSSFFNYTKKVYPEYFFIHPDWY